MCHTNLDIEFCEWVNFITGQNGSGKSAILTALLVAFGCRAKGTQRASTLKDFIKTGCRFCALVFFMIRESNEKASIICPEIEITALGSWELSAQINRVNHRLKRESEKYSESIDDLRIMHDGKEQKIGERRKIYKSFREKIKVCKVAVDSRWKKLGRTKALLLRRLTWEFNSNLRNKGISGQIKVCYEDKTLSIEVKMPQDATSSAVRDTRGLSGGERSFSTLCFALALHNMTDAPIRAIDEFDVFMDAVSRKISLDTLDDFALDKGSQWMFITPHDISMVESDQKIKKQQMAAPRS